MAGSEYYQILGLNDGIIPKVDPKKTKEKINSLLRAMDNSLVKSCHDLSKGGLMVGIAEMSFGGDLGVDLDLSKMNGLRTDFKLFSESNGRWLVEIEKKDEERFENIVSHCKKIGSVTKEREIRIRDGKMELNLSLDELREKWNSAVEREV